MNEVIEGRAVSMSEGPFYSDILKRCHIALEDQPRPAFFNCALLDCSFDPPIPTDGSGFGPWSDAFYGTYVTTSEAINPLISSLPLQEVWEALSDSAKETLRDIVKHPLP